MTDRIDIDAARHLAVRYAAFNEAQNEGDTNGICVWGEMLLKSQAETGIVLYRPEIIRNLIDSARFFEKRAAERNATMWRGNDRELMQDAD